MERASEILKKMNKSTEELSSTLMTSYDFSKCPRCGGEGRIIFEAPDVETYGDDSVLVWFAADCPVCKGGHVDKVEKAKKLSDIPKVFYDRKYDDFKWDIYKTSSGNVIDTSENQKIINHFLLNYKVCKGEGIGLFICSKTKGSGKTLLASCICNELMELYEIKTRFIRTSQLLDISKSGDQTSPDEYKREPIKLLCNCELLVLDDIGQKKTGESWMNDILFKILDERTTKNLVTIFTSNYSISELYDLLDERIIQRMDEKVIQINLPEFNVRSRTAYEKKVNIMRKMGLIKGGG